jgi:hypothetical protein
MSSSSAVGIRCSAPDPVMQLAPYGEPPVTSRSVVRSLNVYGKTPYYTVNYDFRSRRANATRPIEDR